jgi:hypothetical protein
MWELKRSIKKMECTHKLRGRGIGVLVIEKDVLKSEIDNYLGTKFEC